jgi:hypothetical protein
MKDTEADIVKAFLAALTQQEKPLPAAVQNELNSLTETFNTDQIDSIAMKHQPLKTFYEAAYKLLVEQSKTRNKGKDFVPDSSSEKDRTSNIEIDNASSDIQDFKSLPIINENLATLSSAIFTAPDAVQLAQEIFPLISIA